MELDFPGCDPDHLLSFGEFVSALWPLQAPVPEPQDSLESEQQPAAEVLGKSEFEQSTAEGPPNLKKYELSTHKVSQLMREYGTMLPSRDVYCTPDAKVVSFLK